MSAWSRYFFLIIVCGVIIAAAVTGVLIYQSRETESARRGGGPVPVVVAPVRTETFVDRIEALGTAQSNEFVSITAQVTETVREVRFEDGQTVSRGDILAELTDEEEGAELAEARATLLEADQQLERIADLVERGNATQARLDQAVSVRDQARARVRAIEARLSDRLIRAPFDGLLGLRTVSPGTLVTPGTVITTLDAIDPIKLDFSVPETFFAAVRPGLEVTALADAYPDETFSGRITAVDTRLDAVTRSFLARAEIPNGDLRLRPGMLLRVEIEKNARQSLMVPEEAIVPLDTRVFVFRVTGENTVDRVQVEVGARRPGAVEILSGLEAGDRVVVQGTNRVRPGAPVRVLDRSADGSDATGTGMAGPGAQ